MPNLCTLLGLIDSGVEATCYVITVGVTVIKCDRVRIFSLGHDALSNMSVVWRTGREIWRVNGGVHTIIL